MARDTFHVGIYPGVGDWQLLSPKDNQRARNCRRTLPHSILRCGHRGPRIAVRTQHSSIRFRNLDTRYQRMDQPWGSLVLGSHDNRLSHFQL